jgi:hypothetical protein
VRVRSLVALLLLAAAPAAAQEPAFREGDVLGFADVAKLEPFLPPEFWAHRELFFYEGMQLAIGPAHRDYSPAAAYVAATKELAGRARIGPDGSLEGYVAGQPFPMEKIDCARDPDAGTKIAWNFDAQWEGSGTDGRFRLSYWDRGEELPLAIEGSLYEVFTARRVEPAFAALDRSLFRGEKRKSVSALSVDEPFDLRGVAGLRYRHVASEGPARAPRDTDYVYRPEQRRWGRLRAGSRSEGVFGTDFTLDDRKGFGGLVHDYTWTCRGAPVLAAPMNAKRAGYPYPGSHDFGPSGGSYASDRWELRRAVHVRLSPKDSANAPRDLYLDAQTLVALYGFVYDRSGALWKIVWHDHRWSGDSLPQDTAPWYPGWEGVPEPRDLRVVSDAIANVQTGSVTRVDFWDAHGSYEKSTRRKVRHIRPPIMDP